MYKIITKILLIVTVAVFSGCGLSDDTVAKVGDQKIKVDEFIGQLQKRFPGKENFSDIDSSAKMRVLNSMIEGKRKLAAAYDMGLDDNEKVKTSLENQEKSMIFSKYYESMVVDSVIDLNVVKESLDKMKDEVKASHILIKFKGMPGKPVDRTKEEAEKLAQSLAERVRNGESINTLAAEYSDDPSAAQNKGDLGYFTWGRMVDEFQKAAYNLKPGQVSEPVLTNYGYHVIQVEDRRPNPDYDPDNLAGATYRIKNKLFSSARAEGMRRWNELGDKNRAKYNFKLNDENIQKLVSITNEKKEAKKMSPNDYTDEEKSLVLAEYDGGEVTLNDLFDMYKRQPRALMLRLSNQAQLTNEIKNAGSLATGRKEAEKMGFDANPDIQNALKDMKEREMIRLLDQEAVENTPEISEEDLRNYYNEHPDEYKKDAEMEIWEIFVKNENTAKKIARLAKNGRDFESLAKQYNEDKLTQKKAGYLGYRAKTRKGSISAKAFEAGPNQIAGPVKYRNGWSVIKTGQLKPESTQPFEEVKSRVERKLKNETRKKARKDWEEKIKDEYQARINYKLLETI